MAYGADSAPDFKAIADGAKKSPKFREMTGKSAESEGDEPAPGNEDAFLSDAFAALREDDEAGFKTAMAAAMRECYRSVK
jgi:hypothetical protein